MNYLEKIDIFINNIILEDEDDYLIEIDKNDISQEDLIYNYIEEDEMHRCIFNDGNMIYRNLFKLYGEPTAREYHMILEEIQLECDTDIFDFENKEFIEIIELYICITSRYLIQEYNEKKIKNYINKRKNAIITIQKAFRKYRYNPKYKYCKFKQIKNIYNIGAIDKEEFDKYIKKEKILIYF